MATDAERHLAESEARLRALIDALPQLVWRVDATGRRLWSSPQCEAFMGLSRDGTVGEDWLAVVHPEDEDVVRAAWDAAPVTGTLRVEHRMRDAGTGAWRWFETRAAAIRDTDGAIVEWMAASTEVHALRELRDKQATLLSENQHRTRNLMAVVRSMAAASAEGGATVETYRRRFRRRLDALGRANTLLSERPEGKRVTFEALLRTELQAVDALDSRRGGSRVRLEGPPGLPVRSRKVQILALAVHELVANAVEHGALSRKDGRLDVRWSLTADPTPRVRLTWRETGAQVSDDMRKRRGFGREIIEDGLTFQAGALVAFDLTDDGLSCTIEADLEGE